MGTQQRDPQTSVDHDWGQWVVSGRHTAARGGYLGQVSREALSEQHVSCHLKGARLWQHQGKKQGRTLQEGGTACRTLGGQIELRLWEEEKSHKKGCSGCQSGEEAGEADRHLATRDSCRVVVLQGWIGTLV